MSGFASLLNQFKQSTEQAGKAPSIAPTSTRSPTEPKTYKCPTTAIKRIFVACPPIETGGPEALHQLCHVINSGGYQYEVKSEVLQALDVDEFGREIKKATGSEGANLGKVRAYMLYLRERHGAIAVAKDATRPTKYSQYDAPIADVLPGEGCALGQDGNSSDLLIFPEIWTKYIDALQPGANQHHDNASDCRSKRNKYQPAIWWLSVDNNRGAFSPKQFRERCDVLHLAQSNYARKYVTSNIIGIQSIPRNGQAKVLDLTEFIPYANSQSTAANLLSSSQEEVDKQIIECTQTTRDLDVLYNPLKGMHYTDEIIRRSGNKRAKTGVDGIAAAKSSIQFTPIGKGKGYKERLSGDEVFALLKRAKVVSPNNFLRFQCYNKANGTLFN